MEFKISSTLSPASLKSLYPHIGEDTKKNGMTGRVKEREIGLIIWWAVNGKDFKMPFNFSDVNLNYFTLIKRSFHILNNEKLNSKPRLDASQDATCHLTKLR